MKGIDRLGIALSMVAAMACGGAVAQTMTWKEASRQKGGEFFKTDEARRIGDQLLLYQRDTGGWPKNIDMAKPLTDSEKKNVVQAKARRNDSTADNQATNTQMAFLARLYLQTGDTIYRNAVARGAEFLLSGQYGNGGWPQFWPENRGYQVHITYNDNAMVNTLNTIRAMADMTEPFDGDFVNAEQRERLEQAFDKGIECILNTQIVVDGEPTVWCQQHDRETMLPAKARAYELPSFCSAESAGIVGLLLSLPNPDERVKKAVRCAMRWFDEHKLTGVKVVYDEKDGKKANTRLVADTEADTPLWARYYDLQSAEPFACDRDGVPRKHLEELGDDRRNGYSWYNSAPARLYKHYAKWKEKYGAGE